MPSTDTVERFIARVESNAHAEAIEAFYAEHASMQENDAAPRVGRDLLVANERRVLSRAKTVSSKCIRPYFVSGDRVVIRWLFEFVWQDDSTTRIDEIAYQRWEDERIAEEKFFYDPAQMKPKNSTG
ncbi:MAG: nuclear transport factor 2 family protein [Casimicrobium sp.]